MTSSHSLTTATVIRHAVPDDAREVRLLALLDDARPLRGETLVAVVDGELTAALSPEDGRVVANPFVPTAQFVELLRIQAFENELATASRRGGRVIPLRRAAAA